MSDLSPEQVEALTEAMIPMFDPYTDHAQEVARVIVPKVAALVAQAATEARAETEALRARVEVQATALALTARQVREQGDVQQVLMDESGVGPAPTLADELDVIAYLLRAALSTPADTCLCNTGPSTEGPVEDCPRHGRPEFTL